MKKTNNAGFSLVELIVVIAIMAVLVGVLAPQLLRYVERSRISTDNQAVAEVANAIKIASANETIYTSLSDGDEIDLTNLDDGTDLGDELVLTVGSGVQFKASCYEAGSEPKLVIVKGTNGSLGVYGTGICDMDGEAITYEQGKAPIRADGEACGDGEVAY